jgi:hypothetical protein
MIFVPNNQPTKVVKPSEDTLDLPSTAVTTQFSPVLRLRQAIAAIRRNQVNAAFFKKTCVQDIAVVRFVADQPIWEILRPSSVEGLFDQRYLVRRSIGNAGGDRKTMAVCDRHDLASFAAFRFADCVAPFLAPVKEPSIKASVRSSLPRCSKSSASAARIWAKMPSWVHCWNRRWQVWYGGYLSGRSFQGAPVRKTHKMPLSTSRGSRGGRPRPPGFRRIGGTSGSTRRHCSLVRSMPHSSAPVKSSFNYF